MEASSVIQLFTKHIASAPDQVTWIHATSPRVLAPSSYSIFPLMNIPSFG